MNNLDALHIFLAGVCVCVCVCVCVTEAFNRAYTKQGVSLLEWFLYKKKKKKFQGGASLQLGLS